MAYNVKAVGATLELRASVEMQHGLRIKIDPTGSDYLCTFTTSAQNRLWLQRLFRDFGLTQVQKAEVRPDHYVAVSHVSKSVSLLNLIMVFAKLLPNDLWQHHRLDFVLTAPEKNRKSLIVAFVTADSLAKRYPDFTICSRSLIITDGTGERDLNKWTNFANAIKNLQPSYCELVVVKHTHVALAINDTGATSLLTTLSSILSVFPD